MTRALSRAKADRLYWLGRYVERALASSGLVPEATDASFPGTLAFNLAKAYENGFLLRDLLDNEVFSYLRLAATRIESLIPGDYLGHRQIRDHLYAFWGILEEGLAPEAEAFCRWGRFLELWERWSGARDARAETAWEAMAACWSRLGIGEPPGRTSDAVEGWFGRCYVEP